MARPIEATPIVTGKDAEVFLDDMRMNEPVSADRLRWLESVAEASKSAERKKPRLSSTYAGVSR
ncbi:MAG: hypothetical protein ABSA33_06885 [Candidatus Micrarchaeaceae archaeon]|jgi:hypothetical protein